MAVVTNLGTGGAALDAQYGSTPAPNTNEPLLLGHSGTNYLYLPGVAGNFASTPDAAVLDITGDIDIRVRVALDDWTPSGDAALVSKWNGGLNQASYLFLVNPAGTFRLYWSTNGASASFADSTAAPTITNGSALWVRATLDVNNGAAGYDVKFYTAPDQATEPSSWTQLGTTVTGVGVTSIYAGTHELAVGSWESGGAGQAVAKLYRAIVLNGIDGTVVFDADFTSGITSGAQATFTESSADAATVTINRSTSGRKSCAVVRPVWLLGTDDYFEVADNALLDFGASDSFTVVAVVRQWGTTVATYVAKRTSNGNVAGTDVGYTLHNASGSSLLLFRADNGSTIEQSGSVARSDGALASAAAVRTPTSATAYVGSTAGSTTTITAGNLANTNTFRIGRLSGAGTNYADAELLAVAVFRRALSASELAAIAAYYGAS